MPMDGQYATKSRGWRCGYVHGRSRTSMFYATLVLPVHMSRSTTYIRVSVLQYLHSCRPWQLYARFICLSSRTNVRDHKLFECKRSLPLVEMTVYVQ